MSHFIKSIGVGKLRIYFAWNCRLKRKTGRSRGVEHYAGSGITKEKGNMTCELCGFTFPAKKMTVHHVLPRSTFPRLNEDERNKMVVCRCCHEAIHKDRITEFRLMRNKAEEMGIKLESII